MYTEEEYEDFSGLGYAGERNPYQNELVKYYVPVFSERPHPNAPHYSNNFVNFWEQVEAKDTQNWKIAPERVV
jgi:hypothetical protein